MNTSRRYSAARPHLSKQDERFRICISGPQGHPLILSEGKQKVSRSVDASTLAMARCNHCVDSLKAGSRTLCTPIGAPAALRERGIMATIISFVGATLYACQGAKYDLHPGGARSTLTKSPGRSIPRKLDHEREQKIEADPSSKQPKDPTGGPKANK